MPSSRKKQRTASSAAEATPLGASTTSTLPTDDELRLTASLFGTAPPRAAPKHVTIDGDGDDEEDEEETGLEGYDDSQLFQIDGGERQEEDEDEDEDEDESDDDEDDGSSSDASSSASSSSSSSSSSASSSASPQVSSTTTQPRKPRTAWHDPSTSSLIVPLVGPQARAPDGSFAGTKRLRKLRVTADERTITGVEYERRLREQYEKMHPRPAWASNRRALPVAASSKDASANDAAAPTLADLLSRDTGLVASASSRRHRPLPSGQLAIERQRDVLQHPASSTTRFDDAEEEEVADPSVDLASAIETLSFHPSSSSSNARTRLLMTASRDRRVRLYNIDGRENPLLQTVHVPSLPLRRAAWHPGGQSILLAGPRPYLYSYDVQTAKALRSTPWRGLSEDEAERDLSMAEFQPEAGRGLLAIGGRRGKVHLLDWGRSANVAASSGGGGGGGGSHLLTTLTHNAPLAGLAWDGEQQLVSLGQDGSFQVWDTRAMRCSVATRDTGLHAPNHLAASPDGERFAVGTQSGVVAVYSRDSLLSSTSQLEPVKSLSNLITSTSTLRFDGSSQILALASRSKKDALRLAHAKECSVFSNWPTSGTPLGRVSDVAFATPSAGSGGGGGLVAVGNTRGRTLLFKLGHFS